MERTVLGSSEGVKRKYRTNIVVRTLLSLLLRLLQLAHFVSFRNLRNPHCLEGNFESPTTTTTSNIERKKTIIPSPPLLANDFLCVSSAMLERKITAGLVGVRSCVSATNLYTPLSTFHCSQLSLLLCYMTSRYLFCFFKI